MNHAPRREDEPATVASDCQTHVKPLAARGREAESDLQPTAAEPAHAQAYKRTVDALRAVALRLDRIAAEYIDSIHPR